ncbi:alpha/beta hydrolase [Sphingomonas sp. CJ20]
MPIDRRTMLGGAMAVAMAAPAARARVEEAWPPAEHFALWPDAPPGAATASADARAPIVGVYRPARPDGRAVLVMPGGAYLFVSLGNEGASFATPLNRQGITVFVLAYRIPGQGWGQRWDVPLQDAQRAMRLIRARAGTWGIDPARLGIMGFSAGGHLAADLAVAHGDTVYAPVDAADRQSARPAYAGLAYPVVDFASAGPNSRSAFGLMGKDRDPAIVARHTPLARVSPRTPPVFLIHATDDGTVPVTQSVAMFGACLTHKVPVAAHLIEHGGHGFGANLSAESPDRDWIDIFARWTAGREA